MVIQPLPMLSKSRFTAGLQCLKRLYFECYEPRLAPPVSDGQQAIFDTGTAIGVLARDLYPSGVLVDDDHLHHDEAVARTATLLADTTVSAIFEAAFTEDDVRVRVDLLVRSHQGWELIEVKGSSSVKQQYIDDVAIQLWTLERAGLHIRSASVAHINRDYVYLGGEYDPSGLFAVEDVTTDARERLVEIPAELRTMRSALGSGGAPDIDPGPHCFRPYTCEFVEYCHRDAVEWPVTELPAIRPARVQALLEGGQRSILDLTEAEPLSDLQRRVRDVVRSGQPFIGPLLENALRQLQPPIHFVDFETVAPALPVYAGTRPFETLPFQWSDHVWDAAGNVSHFEFLADGSEDPRTAFVTSLLDQLHGAGTIVVYSGYEGFQLRRLAIALPTLRPAIEAAAALHWVDLLQVVRAHYYHRDFRGSFSLKSVLPVLVPTLGYQDLAIQEGATAARTFLESLQPDLPLGARSELRNNLLAYCSRDTEATLEIVRALTRLVAAAR